jgi:hypothetical protein
MLLPANDQNDRTSAAASARLYWVRVNSLVRHPSLVLELLGGLLPCLLPLGLKGTNHGGLLDL